MTNLTKAQEKRFDKKVVLFLYDKYRDDFIKLKTNKFNKVLDDLYDVGKQHLADELVISAKKWREKGIEIGKIRERQEIIEKLEKRRKTVKGFVDRLNLEIDVHRLSELDQAIKTIKGGK